MLKNTHLEGNVLSDRKLSLTHEGHVCSLNINTQKNIASKY